MTVTDPAGRVDALFTVAAVCLAGCAIIAALLLTAVLMWLFLAVCAGIRTLLARRPVSDPPTVPQRRAPAREQTPPAKTSTPAASR